MTPREYLAAHSAHAKYVRRVVAFILRSRPNEIDDCAQDVWLKVWRARRKFAGRCAVRTWLYRVATNTALMRLRSNGRGKKHHFASLEEMVEKNELKMEPLPPQLRVRDRRLESVPEQIAFNSALLELSPRRRALIRAKVEGWTYAELASVTGEHIPTLKSEVFRGKREMRERVAR